MNTVLKLLEEAGRALRSTTTRRVRDLTSERTECDDMRSFCHAEKANVSPEHEGEFGYGDVWTWAALDADVKLAVSWLVGDRVAGNAPDFMQGVADRLAVASSRLRTGTPPT